jgi:hypothetical protein
MITTTLNRIRDHHPCASGWAKLLAGLGKTQADDEPLPYADILRINGLADALWACRCEPDRAREWRLFAVACARQVQHLMTDERSIAALDVAERFANGEATADELAVARRAAYAAYAAYADAADAAYAAADAAAYAAAAADAAAYAAADAAYAAVAAADAAAYAAADAAAVAAADAAYAAAYAAADAAACDWQAAEFLRVVA